MKQFLIVTALFMLAACANKDGKVSTNVEGEHQSPLAQSKNSAAFNASFGKLMSSYYNLKDNFISEKDSAIALYATQLMKDADSLALNELKADSNIVSTAKADAGSISAELNGLLGEKNLEGKRKSFQMVSDELYDLIRVVQYDVEVVYHQFCPMAFNDQGANWLSNSSDIKNPYLPKKMLSCGEVQDSIDFRKK
jgi:Cu(I)/Ag(I) efflux system membrane fusion protein